MSENFADSYAALPDSVAEVFGEEATAERAYDLLTVDVPVGSWIAALEIARDKLGLTYFDWLSAVDEPGVGFRVCAHVASVGPGSVRRLLLRTTVPHAAPSLPSAIAVYAGAAWHERETHEMFGITFTDHPHLVHLLLPDTFEGHPLRKDFVLAARVAKAWPGAKEPGESHDPHAPKRRQMLPPGVPDPNDWGPLKGQLPPAPSRAERPVRRARTAGEGSASQPPTADRPARRARTAGEGSASQQTEAAPAAPEAPAAPAGPGRSRTASGGSASQRAGDLDAAASDEGGAEPGPEAAAPAAPAGPRRNRSASAGSASQRAGATAEPDSAAPAEDRDAAAPDTAGTPAAPVAPAEGGAEPAAAPAAPAGPRRSRTASGGSASQRADAPAEPGSAASAADQDAAAPGATESPEVLAAPAAGGDASSERPAAPPRTRSSDAPWHHARPAFDEEPQAPVPEAPEAPAQGEPGTDAPPAEGEPTTDPTTPTDPAGGDPA
ncbi:NADH-quinone oxidoreductase subunit C [Streptomyces sp. SKN60]|uniref:NADH-quinone oxidoreductase subunit C n=1 Tax=Streptomyces sp. SKN60 TaxID=2855506 RepID=UPI00224785EF|nr:NADH-quinone oxidoreductase subunit C [Streptomyces sp. SKN60]MCX2181046.1 NADH-quinone oxidoreductase subunit C [Streptomyces sp. SKN60]